SLVACTSSPRLSFSCHSILPPPSSPPLFPYTTLFRSMDLVRFAMIDDYGSSYLPPHVWAFGLGWALLAGGFGFVYFWKAEERYRSEEHTSELQSRENLVCRLLLDKKKVMERTRYLLIT